MTKRKSTRSGGKLRIGDSWNAITIIALSQNNPLKAIAEFVENSIDAKARHVTLTKGRESGAMYLRIVDDGNGVPKDEQGKPDFKYVATHICDSIKRKMKAEGAKGIQGEFGIGLLSFWTVGETLKMTCAGTDGKSYQMTMEKGEPGYSVRERRALFALEETELEIRPLLSGVRTLTGEKIHWYLAEELRDRIRRSGVEIKIVDRVARKTFVVEPRVFEGVPIRLAPLATVLGDVHFEIYLNTHPDPRTVALARRGTRVLSDLSRLAPLDRLPWNGGVLEGIVDAAFVNLTPGTRDGVILDDAFDALQRALRTVEPQLVERIEAQRIAEEQRASKQVLKAVQRALREALLMLPQEEYDWFDLNRRAKGPRPEAPDDTSANTEPDGANAPSALDTPRARTEQKQFFEFEGPLFSVMISPSSSAVMVNESKGFRAITRDRSRRTVERDLTLTWRIQQGAGDLAQTTGDVVTFIAPPEPGLTVIEVIARQGDVECQAEAVVTVADELVEKTSRTAGAQKGLPGYTFRRAPGELWRSRYDEEKNLVVINNGHRDFVFASKSKSRRVRYICRLFSKELVHKNFPGIPPDDLLERMVELLLYTEENLR